MFVDCQKLKIKMETGNAKTSDWFRMKDSVLCSVFSSSLIIRIYLLSLQYILSITGSKAPLKDRKWKTETEAPPYLSRIDQNTEEQKLKIYK